MAGPTATTPYRWLRAATGIYDATSGGSLVTTNGATVKRWEDQSGNANHRTDATGCTYATSDNACVFNGSSNKLVGSGSEALVAGVMVVYSNDASGYHTIFGGKNSDSAYDLDALYIANSTGDTPSDVGTNPLAVKRITTSDPSSGGTVSDGAVWGKRLDSQWFTLGWRVVTGNSRTWLQLFINGMMVGQRALTGTVKGISETVIGAGYYNQAVADYANCRIREELSYTTLPTDSEWDDIHDYLATQYSLTLYTAAVSPETYRYGSFLGEDQTRECFALFASANGSTFKAKNCYYYPASGQYVRDTSIVEVSPNLHWVYHTSEDFPSGSSSSFAVAKSTDGLQTLVKVADVDTSAISTSHSWAPEPLIDGANWYLYATTGSVLFVVTPTDPTTQTSWNTPTTLAGQISGASGALIDPFPRKSGSTYGLWYVLLGEAIGYATSASPTASFTQQKAPTTAADAFGWWAGTKTASGFSSDVILEGISVTLLANGTTWRAVWDAYRSVGTKLGLFYSDSTDFNPADGSGTWSTVTAITVPHGLAGRHGSFIRASSAAGAATLPLVGGGLVNGGLVNGGLVN